MTSDLLPGLFGTEAAAARALVTLLEVECQFLYDGDLAYGRRWNLRASALDEAEEKRQELVARGWTMLSE